MKFLQNIFTLAEVVGNHIGITPTIIVTATVEATIFEQIFKLM